jgi:hypothetical protein
MSNNPTTKLARVRNLFAAALVLACTFGTINHTAAQQVTPPPSNNSVLVCMQEEQNHA